jgi:glycerol kinase
MGEQFILAIDQGTTNTKAILGDETGSVLARSSRPVAISFPQSAWVEQSPEEIWESVRVTATEALHAVYPKRPKAIGVSNQRETILLWDRKTGEPLGPAVIWQCRRTANFCQTLRPQEPFLRQRTELTVDPLFSTSKGRWLWDAARAANPRLEPLGSGADQFVWNPFSYSSRIFPSAGILGETDEHDGIPTGIPIASAIGDSHAALFGQRVFKPGSVKAAHGTGTSLKTPVDRPKISDQGLSTTIAGVCPRYSTH